MYQHLRFIWHEMSWDDVNVSYQRLTFGTYISHVAYTSVLEHLNKAKLDLRPVYENIS